MVAINCDLYLNKQFEINNKKFIYSKLIYLGNINAYIHGDIWGNLRVTKGFFAVHNSCYAGFLLRPDGTASTLTINLRHPFLLKFRPVFKRNSRCFESVCVVIVINHLPINYRIILTRKTAQRRFVEEQTNRFLGAN